MNEQINIRTKPLSELVIINNGIDYKKNPKGEEIPIYGTGGIMGYTSIALNEGPAVLTGRKGSINRPFYLQGKFWNVDTIFCLKPFVDIDAKWLYYSILNVDMTKLNEATGVPSITSKALYRLKINYFKPEKQQKIAKILTTCDTVIEQTQAAIAKYKAIKQGMLHDLFTRGLDANGKLRPTFQQAPELYKESELGMIPKEWEECKMGKYILANLYGPRFDAKDYSENGNVKTIRGTDFTKEGFILYDQAPKAFLPRDLINAHKLNTGDLVIVTTANCGLTAVFQKPINDVDFIPSAYSVKYKFSESFNPYYIKLFMETPFAICQVNKYVRQGTLGNLPGSDILSFNIFKPDKIEQNEITKRIHSIDNKLKTEEAFLSKYQNIKRGLMGDLMSGKKEV